MRKSICLFALVLSCTGTPTLIPDDAPPWLAQGSRATEGEAGKVFRGIGAATNIAAPGPRRQTAETRARAELAKVIDAFTQQLLPATKEAGKEPSAEALQAYAGAAIGKAVAVQEWTDRDGTTYVLVELPLAKLKEAVSEGDSALLPMKDRAEPTFDGYADQSAVAAAAKTTLPAGTCVKALRFGEVPKTKPVCGPIRAATIPGWLIYPCAGGKAQAVFGEITFAGTIDASKKLDLTFGPAVVYQKGCTWKQTERLVGTADGGLAYERDQTLVSPSTDEDCPESCTVESKVAVK
ncbi:MAG: hypothetical protein IT381_26245 [Deltaproteobacteria bacterium]|nr:hypothetical protein [Deltaproteobacteria bacterium]